MNPDAVQNVAVAVAAIVGISLALSQALGGLLTYLTEAIKATGKVPDGYAGVVALLLGIVLGATLGGLSSAMTADGYGLGVMLALGAFAGAIMAAGAVKTYKAMGQINTSGATPAAPERTDLATMSDLDGAIQHAKTYTNQALSTVVPSLVNLPKSSGAEIDAAVQFHQGVMAAKAQADAAPAEAPPEPEAQPQAGSGRYALGHADGMLK